MAQNKQRALKSMDSLAAESELRREVDNFIRAIKSYPDRFAKDPLLSFQRHLASITAESQARAEHRRR